MKSQVHLKMAGMPYKFERGRPQEAPKGKIPYIQIGAHRLGDSTFIRRHIEDEHRFDFDAGLCTAERAQAWSIERMLEDHLYFALVHYRWMDDVNFENGPGAFLRRPAGRGAQGRARKRARHAASPGVRAAQRCRDRRAGRALAATRCRPCSATSPM